MTRRASATNYTGLGDRTFAPNPKQAKMYQITDGFSLTKGAHGLKFGGELWHLRGFAGTSNAARGTFTFNGQFTSRTPGQGTGNAIADLLLGQTSNAALTTRQIVHMHANNYGLYFNDNWKVSPRLTLNLGLRYELMTRFRERDNRHASFDLNPGSPTFGTVVLAKDGSHRDQTFSDLTSVFALSCPSCPFLLCKDLPSSGCLDHKLTPVRHRRANTRRKQ